MQPISCDLHDSVEVACLYRYDIRVTRHDGTTETGRAVSTRTSSGLEYLVLERDSAQCDIPMHEIALITVLTKHAKFTSIRF